MCCQIVDFVAEADPRVAAFGGEALGGVIERTRNAATSVLGEDEDVLDLRDAKLGARPSDVRMADRLVNVPRD